MKLLYDKLNMLGDMVQIETIVYASVLTKIVVLDLEYSLIQYIKEHFDRKQ
jgi:hypothetical protein